VQFARVAGPDTVEGWIHERGAGETLASGSSACAIAVVAYHLGLVSGRELRVRMPGGDAHVTLREGGMVRLRGPAQIVFRGGVRGEVAAGWG
jgi:diaminopimelate epimerase